MNQSLVIVGLVGCSHCMEFKIKYLNYLTIYMKTNFSIPVIYYEITGKEDAIKNGTYDLLELKNFNVPCASLVHNDFFDDKDEYWALPLDMQNIVNVIQEEYQLKFYFDENIKSLNSKLNELKPQRYYKLKRN